jgi:hypothetical protein
MSPQSDLAALHAWAADETATLVGRFADARTRAIARDLDAVRKAFDAAARSIEASLATPAQSKDEIGTFVERLTTHVGLDAIRTKLQEDDAENQNLKAMLTSARTELDVARLDLEAHRERAAAVRADTVLMSTQLQEQDAENLGLKATLTSARTELERARHDLEAERGRAEAERERAEVTRANTALMTADFERTLDELHREHATVVAEQAVSCTSLPLDELLTVFGALRKAETVPQLLTTLVNGLAREFSRVALFDVDGNRLLGNEQLGFNLGGGDISTVAIPLAVDSMLTRAVNTGRLETIIMGMRNETGTSLPFGGTPACALAIPIIVQGTTTAVIYADDSDHVEFATAAPHSRAKFAELLQQHALLVLVRIWVEQKGVADLREFAARLVVDLEYTYQVEAEAGRNRLQCQQRLKDDVESSRKRYAERAAREDRGAAGVLDEHLAAAAKARKDSAFGQDLADVLEPGSRGSSRSNVVSMYR